MNHQKSLKRVAQLTSLLTLIFFACIISAQAQIFPFVDCVERVPGDSTKYVAYFGYNSQQPGNTPIPPNTPSNYFSPTLLADGQIPTVFLPGIHRRVVAVTLDISVNETWFLSSGSATASFDNNRLCGERDGANSRLITYQGKLNDGAAAANGVYDLQFQLFNGASGTDARTTPITVEDVSVTNGIFTVQLDLGAATVLAASTTSVNLKLNPAIVDAENTFIEIGVRPGTSTDAFIKLAPRQPLTAVPLAMRANTAATAFSAVNADNAKNAVNAQNAANATTATTATTANNVSGIVAVANGGTGSSTKNFVDTTTAQTIAGDKNFTGNTTLGGGARIQNLAADPEAASAANTGRVYYNTAIGSLRFSNGTTWITAGQPVTYHLYATAGRLAVASTTLTVQPGLSQAITVPAGFTANVVVSANIGTRNTQPTVNLFSNVDFVLFLDNNFFPKGGYNRFSTVNPGATGNSFGNSAINSAIGIGAGTHTFEVRTSRSSGTVSVDIGGNAALDVNAGELTLTVYYSPITFVNRSENADSPASEESEKNISNGAQTNKKPIVKP